MIESIKFLPSAGNESEKKEGHETLFEQYDLEKIQHAVCIHFYYTEFLENVK